MNRQLLIVTLVLIFATVSAQAKNIYKTVGPDGKITYSDHPPDDSSSKSDVVHSTPNPTPATDSKPAVDEARVDSGSEPKAARALGAKKAIAVKPAANAPMSAAAPADKTIDPALEGAVIGVLGIEDIVKHTEELCIKTLPTSFRKYSDASTDWQRRNAAIVTRAHQLVSKNFDATYGAGTEQRLKDAIRTKNTGMFEPIASAPMASRIKWCDRSADEMSNGAMDVYDKPKFRPCSLTGKPHPQPSATRPGAARMGLGASSARHRPSRSTRTRPRTQRAHRHINPAHVTRGRCCARTARFDRCPCAG